MYKKIQEYKEYRMWGLIELYDEDSKTTLLKAKVKQIVDYIKIHNIKDVTVGFSGGADSTLVLLLLCLAKKEYDFNIHAITISSQDSRESSFNFGSIAHIRKLEIFKDVIHEIIHHTQSDSLIKSFKGWKLSDKTLHQSFYQSMYNILFTHAQHTGGITIGTTNLDEFSYLGWFGKNSDMMVDLQIITDLHKFEVMAILEYYGISINQEPTGDIPGGVTDEEYFQADYDSISYYTFCKCHGNDPGYILPEVDNLHRDNYHKYLGQTFNPVFLIDFDRAFVYKNTISYPTF